MDVCSWASTTIVIVRSMAESHATWQSPGTIYQPAQQNEMSCREIPTSAFQASSE